ncbi:MAG: DUF4287 domain-containing protein [Bacteroidetes bacterium]|nr:DUF4287 domain-containing protein [Bacteroidota bacterium]
MDKALQTMIDNMPEKTGKSLNEWKVLLQKIAFDKHGEIVNFLKTEHQLTHGYANTIALLAKQDDTKTVDLVAEQYTGKENLIPIYNKLLDVVNGFGADVVATPKKQNVSVIRKRQFALIQPSTKTRIDLGLKLKDSPFTNRLENSGPFGTMCSHRVRIESLTDIDTELIGWLQKAYQQSC